MERTGVDPVRRKQVGKPESRWERSPSRVMSFDSLPEHASDPVQPPGAQQAKASGIPQEIFNAVTMVPVFLVLVARTEPPPVAFTLLAFVHMCASMSFHFILVGNQMKIPFLVARPWLPRAAMDVDMALIYVVGILCTSILATTTFSASLGLLFNGLGLGIIATSRAHDRSEVESELLMRRYPLLAAGMHWEAAMIWLYHGSPNNALGLVLSFAFTCASVLVDEKLHGWGHGLGHLFLVPGMIFRSEALAVAIR